MTTSRYTICPKWRSFIITSLFCLLVSIATYTIWGGKAYVHVM
ncbi:hypothetical protein VII00023_09024, partial [Vibrio ichthyoenteri ATCC 700023]